MYIELLEFESFLSDPSMKLETFFDEKFSIYLNIGTQVDKLSWFWETKMSSVILVVETIFLINYVGCSKIKSLASRLEKQFNFRFVLKPAFWNRYLCLIFKKYIKNNHTISKTETTSWNKYVLLSFNFSYYVLNNASRYNQIQMLLHEEKKLPSTIE